MKLALCNEVLAPMTLAWQCAYAAGLGYDGLEIAPFTLAPDPARLRDAEIAAIAATIADHGLCVTSLHWLLVAPEGLSITASDAQTIARTRDTLFALVDLAAGLGAKAMVHGSPAQRRLGAQPERERQIAMAHLEAAAARAHASGIAYCLEALSSDECNFCNRLEEAEALIEAIGGPGLALMLDICHAAREEDEILSVLVERHLAAGRLAHIQLNAANRRGPGQADREDGPDAILPVLDALMRGGYDGALAVEPFDYRPDGPGCAAHAAGYVRGCLEGLKSRWAQTNR